MIVGEDDHNFLGTSGFNFERSKINRKNMLIDATIVINEKMIISLQD